MTREEVLRHVREQYGTQPDNPWGETLPGAAFAALLYSRPASSKEATLLYGPSFRQNAHLFHGVSIFSSIMTILL